MQTMMADNANTEVERMKMECTRHGHAIVDAQSTVGVLRSKMLTLESTNAQMGNDLAGERQEVLRLKTILASSENAPVLNHAAADNFSSANAGFFTPVSRTVHNHEFSLNPFHASIATPRLPEIVRTNPNPGGGPPGGSDGGDSSEYDSDYSEGKGPNDTPAMCSRRTRLKKSWKRYNDFHHPLVLNAIPSHAGKIKAWKEHVRSAIVDSAKSGDKAFRWVMKIEDPDLADDSFRVPAPKWVPLDAKLRASLLKDVGNGPLGKLIALKTEEERVQFRRQIAGGFILRLVYRHFQMTTSLSQYFDFGDVMKVNFRGDPHLAEFYHQWNSVLHGLLHPEQLHPDVRKEMFLKQIKQSTLMKYDLEHYARLPSDHADKSYKWLCDRVEDRLKDERVKVVEHQLGYGSQGGGGPPALAAAGGGEQVCRFFAAGHCNRGNECRNSHTIPRGYVIPEAKGKGDKGGKGEKGGKGDAKGKGKKGKDESHGDKGKGKGKQGKDGKGPPKVHGSKGDPNATTPCFRFNEGVCESKACPHNHRTMSKLELETKKGYDDARKLRRPKSPGAAALGDCADWASATGCALGTSCPQKHDAANAPSRKAKAKAKAAASA
jgi:hypothetical protein